MRRFLNRPHQRQRPQGEGDAELRPRREAGDLLGRVVTRRLLGPSPANGGPPPAYRSPGRIASSIVPARSDGNVPVRTCRWNSEQGPILHASDVAMLHRIEVDDIHMCRQILVGRVSTRLARVEPQATCGDATALPRTGDPPESGRDGITACDRRWLNAAGRRRFPTR